MKREPKFFDSEERAMHLVKRRNVHDDATASSGDDCCVAYATFAG